MTGLEEFSTLLSSNFIFCLASGEVDGEMKYYLYTKDSTEKKLFLMEVVIDVNTLDGKLTLKSAGNTERDITDFVNYYFTSINNIIVHPV